MRKRANQSEAGGSMQPHSRIIFDIGFGDRDFGAVAGIRNRRHGGNELWSDLAQMLWKKFSLVVRKHAVFLRIVDDGISREIDLHFFAVDFYLLLRQRRFEAVGGAFVVGAKDNGVAAF